MPLIAIFNPVCGNHSAKTFFNQHVLPLLSSNGYTIDSLVETLRPGHAGQVLVDLLKSTSDSSDITVVLGSGDGTFHEIINHLSSVTLSGTRTIIPRLHFALVPCGTANALFESLFPSGGNDGDSVRHKLRSVNSFIKLSRTVPLTLAITTLSPPPNEKRRPQVAVSSVVTSTALHATILQDSEKLREEIPSIDRFKVAAERNSTNWYSSYVKLLPAPNAARVQIYDPLQKTFIDHPESTDDDPIIDLDGPFAYFLSTVNVDRLEPSFRIAPLARTLPSTEATCDVVLIRPLRDPSTSWDSYEARVAFVPKLWAVLSAAYQDGAHINLRYDNIGQIVTAGNGPSVTEYLRCGGWEWIPDEIDDSAHLLCSDGALFQIERGGRAVCSAALPKDNMGFAIYT